MQNNIEKNKESIVVTDNQFTAIKKFANDVALGPLIQLVTKLIQHCEKDIDENTQHYCVDVDGQLCEVSKSEYIKNITTQLDNLLHDKFPNVIPLDVGCNMPLHIWLSVEKANYITTIDIPTVEAARELYVRYDGLRRAAIACWSEFCNNHPDLILHCEYICGCSLRQLTIHPTVQTSLYFNQNDPFMLAIAVAYYNTNNNKLYRKGDYYHS